MRVLLNYMNVFHVIFYFWFTCVINKSINNIMFSSSVCKWNFKVYLFLFSFKICFGYFILLIFLLAWIISLWPINLSTILHMHVNINYTVGAQIQKCKDHFSSFPWEKVCFLLTTWKKGHIRFHHSMKEE